MQNPLLHSSLNNSILNPPVTNPDGSDKNFGGFDDNGSPENQTTEKYPGNESNPGDKPNYPDNHKEASSNQESGNSSAGSDTSPNVAELDDVEDEASRRGDNPLNEKFSTNRGHPPPGDESITNRGKGSGSADK